MTARRTPRCAPRWRVGTHGAPVLGLTPVIKPGEAALSRARLAHVDQYYVRAENHAAANALLIEAQAQIPIAQAWGGGLLASVDGLRFVVPVRTINAGPSPRYFGYKRGITWLNAVNDQVAGIGQMVVPGTPRDSLFILDTLLNLDAGPKPEVVTTDNASYSDMVFGVFAILNYRFAPRFADLPDQRYWRATLPDPLPDGVDVSPEQQAIRDYGPLEPIARNSINVAKIATQWPDMLRVAGSLVTNQVRAYDLLRMFGRDGHPTPLGQAFIEYGRIAKTLHLLALVDPIDGTYQRRMNRQLTVQESRHRLGRKSATATAARSGRPTAKAKKTSSPPSAWSSTQSCCGTPATSTPSSSTCAAAAATRARRGRRPAVPARTRAPQLPGPLRLHHPAAGRAATAARPERTRWRGRRRVLTSP